MIKNLGLNIKMATETEPRFNKQEFFEDNFTSYDNAVKKEKKIACLTPPLTQRQARLRWSLTK